MRSSRWPARLGAIALCAAAATGCSSAPTASTSAGPAASASGASGGGDSQVGAGSATAPATVAPPTTAAAAPAVPSKGCGTSTVKAVEKQQVTVAAGGAGRFYLLTTPAAHDGKTPLPLVLDFHGLLEGAQIHSGMSNLSALAQKEGFVVAFPNGSGNPIHWDANPLHDPNEDLQYVDAMIAQLERDLCIDTARVYSTGLSYGAIFTTFLLCHRPGVFAAVAPVAGLQDTENCPTTEKTPILAFHGTADPILLFNGGYGDAVGGMLGGKLPDGAAPSTTTAPAYDLDGKGYPANVRAWAERYGCDKAPTDTKVGTDVVRRTYACPGGTAVEFLVIVGGGHSWPGSEFSKGIEKIVGPTTFTIEANVEMWRFFQRYARRA